MLSSFINITLLAIISLALAADLQLVFTSTPLAVVAGRTYNLTWLGSDGASHVTIELRRGDAANLTWFAYLTSMSDFTREYSDHLRPPPDATNGLFLWTVSPDLPDGTDYALQIFEMANITNVNYSARFSLSCSTLAPTSITNQAVGTVGTGSSMGTGTALPRNTTFVTTKLTSLATACSGLNGICTGPAAPTATTTLAATYVSTLASTVTITATGEAAAFVSSLPRAAVPAVMAMLVML